MMANALYQQMQAQNNLNPMMQFMQEFGRFRQSFRGDPQQEIQRMLNAGQLTQQQFNQYAAQAQQIARMLGMK